MASEIKLTDAAMCNMLRHNNREIMESTTNPGIKTAEEMEKLGRKNYKFDLGHCQISDYKYYKNLIKGKYIYGRGTSREKETITGGEWVVSIPREIIGDLDKELKFSQGVVQFCSNRYGSENIISAVIHYDESGKGPHIHIIFCPVTVLDHDRVHFKTAKTKEAVRLLSGRYEFKHRFVLDKDGNRIPLKNYSRMSDYFDEKISANDVLNKIELKHFHADLQKFLDDNGIEGRVITGKTGGINFTIHDLKEFTKTTGLQLDDIRELQGDKSLLISYIEKHSKIRDLEELLSQKNAVIQMLRNELLEKDRSQEISQLKETILQKDSQIKTLSATVSDKDKALSVEVNKNNEMQRILTEKERSLSEKQKELDLASKRIKELETERQIAAQSKEKEHSHEWGYGSEGWVHENDHSGGWEKTKEVHTW